jgi:tetratricopeptide (TPR) repeat protein
MKLLTLLCILSLLLLTVPAHAYLVYFKNGSTMEVQSHRVEGDKVYLKLKGGETAFGKDQIDLEKTASDYDAYQKIMKKAQAALDKGDSAGAVKLYKDLTGTDPDDVQARFHLGVALTKAKRYDEAIHELMRASELDPSWRKVKTRLGDIYYRQGSYYEAIDQYLLALDEDPKDKEAHLGLGMCYAKQDMYEGAITELLKAIELRPDYAEAYSTLGYVYYKKASFQEAMAALQKAVELDGSLPEAHYYMGLVYGVLGVEARDTKVQRDYFDKSIESFRRAVTLRREFPEAHADLGIAHNNLAGIYIRQGFYEEAVTEAKKAVSIDPHMTESYFIMGNAYASMRKFKDAARAYDRYLYYSPDGDLSDEVRSRLERVLQEGGLKESTE